jgi:hypothetical protein
LADTVEDDVDRYQSKERRREGKRWRKERARERREERGRERQWDRDDSHRETERKGELHKSIRNDDVIARFQEALMHQGSKEFLLTEEFLSDLRLFLPTPQEFDYLVVRDSLSCSLPPLSLSLSLSLSFPLYLHWDSLYRAAWVSERHWVRPSALSSSVNKKIHILCIYSHISPLGSEWDSQIGATCVEHRVPNEVRRNNGKSEAGYALSLSLSRFYISFSDLCLSRAPSLFYSSSLVSRLFLLSLFVLSSLSYLSLLSLSLSLLPFHHTDVEALAKATEEVMQSKKFSKILQYVLVLSGMLNGNATNIGKKRGRQRQTQTQTQTDTEQRHRNDKEWDRETRRERGKANRDREKR